MKKLFKEIYCDVYNVHLIVMAGCSHTEAIKETRKHFNVETDFGEDDAGAMAGFYGEKGYVVVVWFSHRRPRLETIVHESIHAALDIFKHCSIEMDYDHQEAFAYYSGAIFNRINRALKN